MTPLNDAQPPRPTPAELEILRVLWQQGPSTVREVQERLEAERRTGYTTVLKLLQIMIAEPTTVDAGPTVSPECSTMNSPLASATPPACSGAGTKSPYQYAVMLPSP